MGQTALVVRVPEAEALVADLRARFDPSAAEGVPAHITVLVPFVPLEQIDAATAARLDAALRAMPAFAFGLARVERFPQTAWLAPEPAAPFIALTQAVLREFPDWLPYGGAHDRIVPHLTAADGDAGAAAGAATELAARLARHGAVHAQCREVELLDNRGGRWHLERRFALGPASHPA